MTTLQRCSRCRLLFRQPTTSAQKSLHFYRDEYSQGFTTHLPSQCELKHLIATRFSGSEKDFSVYLEVLAALGIQKGSRIVDFGCSWGYGSWQMRSAGYEVMGVEVGVSRRRYAQEMLGLDVCEALDSVSGKCDVFFSAHVLEHVPSIHVVLGQAFDLLKDNGLFVAFTPNGCHGFRRLHPKRWHRLWGAVHPQFLDDGFYESVFSDVPMLMASNSYDISALRHAWLRARARKSCDLDLGGHELLCVARKHEGQGRWGDLRP